MSTEQRIPSIDVAKGVAILFVIGIHAELFFPGVLYGHVISRAVPMFLVLFGMTSTMWWDKHEGRRSLARWYKTRLLRLLPPYWLAVLLWWGGQRALSQDPVGMEALAWSLAAYAPWIQTSWFVTAILQLVVIFPLLHLALKEAGKSVCLVAALMIMAAAQTYALPLTGWLRELLPHYDATLGFYAFWIFVPHYLWLVLFGMSFTTFAAGISPVQAVFAFAAFLTAGLVDLATTDPSPVLRIAMTIADVGRTVLLLVCATVVAPIKLLTSLLSWCGRNSWEIYVGQMAIHSLGYSAWCRMGGPSAHRVEYATVLLIGGVGFAFGYSELRRWLSARSARA